LTLSERHHCWFGDEGKGQERKEKGGGPGVEKPKTRRGTSLYSKPRAPKGDVHWGEKASGGEDGVKDARGCNGGSGEGEGPTHTPQEPRTNDKLRLHFSKGGKRRGREIGKRKIHPEDHSIKQKEEAEKEVPKGGGGNEDGNKENPQDVKH